jgi:hypothetical protein
MEIAKLFESYFECSEAYKIVDRLKQTVLNQNEMSHFFEYLVSNNVDLKTDFLRDLFQSEHGDRDKFKQDFTPDSIAQIIASQMTDSGSVKSRSFLPLSIWEILRIGSSMLDIYFLPSHQFGAGKGSV